MDTKAEKFVENDDVIILDDSEMPRPIISFNKHKKRIKRKVNFKDSIIKNILVVTQKVEVKKRKKGCIISVNTNVTDSSVNKRPQKSHNRIKNISAKKPDEDRKVPNCLRPKCRSSKPKIEDSKIKCNTTNLQKESRQKSSTLRNVLPRDLRQLVSPVSSPPLKNSLSYEDISVDSFQYSETELDTLIKRTKEREKSHQTSKSDKVCIEPISTSTPKENMFEEIDMKNAEDSTIAIMTPKYIYDGYDMAYSPIKHEYDAYLEDNSVYFQDCNAYIHGNTYLQNGNAYLQNGNTYLQGGNAYLPDGNIYFQEYENRYL